MPTRDRMQSTPSASSGSRSIGLSAIFVALLTLQLTYILSLQAFPTQDGPVHLYYSVVVSDLLAGGDDFGWFFDLRHAFPPYAFLTYVLVVLNQVFDPLLSEKVLICAYTSSFCLGFRYLVRAIADEDSVSELLCFPVALHGLLFMGFYNFCFGVAVTLWLAGYWIRYAPSMLFRRGVVVCALVLLLLTMHPVALLVGLVVMWVHLALSLAMSLGRQDAPSGRPRREIWMSFRPAVLTALTASASLIWIAHYTESRNVEWPSLAHLSSRLPDFFVFSKVFPLHPLPYRAMFSLGAYAVIVLIVASAFRGSSGDRLRMVKAGTLLSSAILCLIAYMTVPESMNQSGFFPHRFLLFALIFILASSGTVRLTVVGRRVFIVLVTTACLILVSAEWSASHAIVDSWRPLLTGKRHGRVMELSAESRSSLADPTGIFTFEPNWWAGAHYARRSRAALMNTPWLDLPIMMLGAKVQASPLCMEPDERVRCLMNQATRTLPPDILVNVRRGEGEAGVTGQAIASRHHLTLQPGSNSSFDVYEK
jgi:hypothetical protein